MNKLIFILLLSVLPVFSFCQGWELVFGGGGDDNQGHEIIQTSDSAYAVVGRIGCDFASNCYPFISKISQNGNLEWTKFLNDDTTGYANGVAEDTNGNLIVVGYNSIPSFGKKLFLTKLNNEGEEIWTNFIEDFPDITSLEGKKVLITANDHYLVLGCGWSATLFKGAVYLAEFNQDGIELWSELYWFDRSTRPNDFTIDNDGNIWVIGEDQNSQTIEKNYFLMKTDAEGQLFFGNSIGTDNTEIGKSIIALEDNSILVMIWEFTEESLLMVHFDSEGQLLWEINYGQNISNFHPIIKSHDNYLIINNGPTPGNGLLYKINYDGDIIWEKEIPKTDTLTGPRSFRDISLANDGGFVLCGTYIFMSAQSIYIIKLDSQGNLVNTIEINEEKLFPIQLYPNPASGYFTIQQLEFVPDLTFELFNKTGQLVKTGKLPSQKTTINIDNLPSGVYSFIIKKGGKLFSNGKIMVQK